MPLVRANADALLHEGLRVILFQKYKEAQPLWREIYNTSTSKKKYEKGLGFAGVGNLVEKPERTGTTEDVPIQGYETTIIHRSFGLKCGISREMHDDDLYKVIQKIPQALAIAAVRTQETYAARLFNTGFTTVGGYFQAGGDGKPLFALDHPLVGGGVQANKLAVAADLTVTSLEEALYVMRRTKGDRGEFLALQPKGLLIPPELSRKATELLESTLRPDVHTHAVNWAAQQGLTLIAPQGWVYLTSPRAWFLLCSKEQHNLEFITRSELEDDMWRDPDTKDYIYSVYIRFSVGYWDFRGVFGTEGA